MYDWAQSLREMGYGALVVDSFTPRSQTNVCGSGRNPTMTEVTGDAYGAMAYLRGLEWVDGSRLAVMGFSFGGGATLYAARRVAVNRYASSGGGGFRAAIAFYPPCQLGGYDTEVPLLMLLAGRDGWTPPSGCQQLADALTRQGQVVRANVYPAANHAFDQPGPLRTYLGHTMSYDGAATSDARSEVERFLAQVFQHAR